MTQAFNLSQLANNLNSAGQLDATDGLVNAVPIANGGTGASTASTARTNLGVAIGTDVPSVTGSGASGTWNISISGTAATATNPASGGSFITSSNIGAQSVNYATTAGNGGVTSVNTKTGAVQSVTTLGTVNTSSGATEKGFTGIPSWVTKITMTLVGVTPSSTDTLVQIGSGSYTTSGYISTGQNVYSGSGSTQSSTQGFSIATYSGYVASGQVTLIKQTGNVWTSTHMMTYDTSGISLGAGSVSLSGAVDRIRITSVSGSSTFSGNVNIMYE